MTRQTSAGLLAWICTWAGGERRVYAKTLADARNVFRAVYGFYPDVARYIGKGGK